MKQGRCPGEARVLDQSQVLQVYLQAGDLTYVPPTVITSIARFMSNIQAILQPFMSTEQMVVLWPQFKEAMQGRSVEVAISTPTSSGTGMSGRSCTTSTSSSSSQLRMLTFFCSS